jgi:serine/threonine protein kinase
MRPMGDITEPHIKNEIRVAVKLCQTGAHPNIVAVYDLGKLPKSSFYFLDMERCDLNLRSYIYGKWTSNIMQKVPELVHTTRDERAVELRNIMLGITNGVAFIHSHEEIHRDLKPHNSMMFPVSIPDPF